MIMNCTIPTTACQLIKTKLATSWVHNNTQYSYKATYGEVQELYIMCIKPIVRLSWAFEFGGKLYRQLIKV